MPVYCFTIDDNIRFLEELVREGARSLFQSPYLGMLQRLHRRFSCKVQLNMFYSYSPGSFSLADCPDRFREEFSENAGWLRLSFHARHNDPPFPYDGRDAALLADFGETMGELLRIAGEKALARTTTLHYVTAGRKACQGLRERGVLALLGMYLDLPGRGALRNCLTREEARPLLSRSFLRDEGTGLVMARNDLVLNQYPLSEIVPRLKAIVSRDNPDAFVEIMIHEQYFYPDYRDYQPDFEEKLVSALSFLTEAGYRSLFLEEALPAGEPASPSHTGRQTP